MVNKNIRLVIDGNVRSARYRECLLRALIVFALLFGMNLIFLIVHFMFGIGFSYGWDLAGIALMPFLFSGVYAVFLFVYPRLPFLYPVLILILDLWVGYPYTHPQITDALYTLKSGICNAIEFLYYYKIVTGIKMEVSVLLFGVCVYELIILWVARKIHRKLAAR